MEPISRDKVRARYELPDKVEVIAISTGTDEDFRKRLDEKRLEDGLTMIINGHLLIQKYFPDPIIWTPATKRLS